MGIFALAKELATINTSTTKLSSFQFLTNLKNIISKSIQQKQDINSVSMFKEACITETGLSLPKENSWLKIATYIPLAYNLHKTALELTEEELLKLYEDVNEKRQKKYKEVDNEAQTMFENYNVYQNLYKIKDGKKVHYEPGDVDKYLQEPIISDSISDEIIERVKEVNGLPETYTKKEVLSWLKENYPEFSNMKREDLFNNILDGMVYNNRLVYPSNVRAFMDSPAYKEFTEKHGLTGTDDAESIALSSLLSSAVEFVPGVAKKNDRDYVELTDDTGEIVTDENGNPIRALDTDNIFERYWRGNVNSNIKYFLQNYKNSLENKTKMRSDSLDGFFNVKSWGGDEDEPVETEELKMTIDPGASISEEYYLTPEEQSEVDDLFNRVKKYLPNIFPKGKDLRHRLSLLLNIIKQNKVDTITQANDVLNVNYLGKALQASFNYLNNIQGTEEEKLDFATKDYVENALNKYKVSPHAKIEKSEMSESDVRNNIKDIMTYGSMADIRMGTLGRRSLGADIAEYFGSKYYEMPENKEEAEKDGFYGEFTKPDKTMSAVMSRFREQGGEDLLNLESYILAAQSALKDTSSEEVDAIANRFTETGGAGEVGVDNTELVRIIKDIRELGNGSDYAKEYKYVPLFKFLAEHEYEKFPERMEELTIKPEEKKEKEEVEKIEPEILDITNYKIKEDEKEESEELNVTSSLTKKSEDLEYGDTKEDSTNRTNPKDLEVPEEVTKKVDLEYKKEDRPKVTMEELSKYFRALRNESEDDFNEVYETIKSSGIEEDIVQFLDIYKENSFKFMETVNEMNYRTNSDHGHEYYRSKIITKVFPVLLTIPSFIEVAQNVEHIENKKPTVPSLDSVTLEDITNAQ